MCVDEGVQHSVLILDQYLLVQPHVSSRVSSRRESAVSEEVALEEGCWKDLVAEVAEVAQAALALCG